MTATPQSILSHEGIEVLTTNEPGLFNYIPTARPEVSLAGAPSLMLLKNPGGSVLQMGAQLGADEPVLEKIRAVLRSKQEQPVAIRLEPAPLTVRSARLLLIMLSGTQELQRSTTSALSPYTALFRASLNAEQTKAVEEALAGKQGKLTVVYDIELPTVASARVQLEGTVTELVRNLGKDVSDEATLTAIEEALAGRQLRVTEERSGSDADGLVKQAWDAAKSKAARMLLSYQNPPLSEWAKRDDTLKSEVRLQEPRTIALTRDTDVADWFGGGKKATVLATSATIPSGSARAVKVSLGFEAKDTPLAFIEVKGSSPQPGVLRSPGFAPILVNTSGALDLRVHYSSNAPVFLNEVLTQGTERALSLEELGLVQIVLDASERKSAGAKKLTGTVSYLRDGEEVENWPVRFQFGDWTDRWFVVTGGPGLSGSLKYEWQETGPDGSVTTGGPITTDRTTIQIR